MAKAGKETYAVGMAQSVASLAGGIKPTMFKNGFNVSRLIQSAGTFKTLAGAGGTLESLEAAWNRKHVQAALRHRNQDGKAR